MYRPVKSGTGVLLCLAFCSGLVAVGSSEAQLLPPDPLADWDEIRTDHFTIHYVSGSDSLAGVLAAIAEWTYETFSDDLDLRPPGRVEVFLQESYDIVNSAAAPSLHRSIFIFPDPPYGGAYSALGHYTDWMKLAFVHEYAHIVDLERRKNLWEAFHVLTHFGYPNLHRPLWTVEGFAVWAESRYTGGGRIGSPTTDMVIRADVLEGRLRDPYEWSGAYDPWPNGAMPYLYGGEFMEFLADRYGENTPVEYRGETAGAMPWRYASSLVYATRGKPFSIVLMEFYQSIKARAESSLAWIEEQGDPIEGKFMARPGTIISDILPRSDGSTVLVACSADQDQQRILSLDTRTGRSRHLIRTSGEDVRITEDHRDGRIVYSDLDVEANSRLVSQLRSMRPTGGGKSDVSRVGRLHEPAVSPADGTLLACKRERGRSFLVEVEPTAIHRVKTSIPPAADVFHPAWSPNGKNLVASVWQPTGQQDIWLIDYPSGKARPLTDDEHWNSAPVFSPDGHHVLFGSDRSGVWNIYALEISSSRVFQITHVTTGAFLPGVSLDGEWLYFVRYTPEGDEVRRLPFDPDSWLEVPPERQPRLPGHEEYLLRFRTHRRGPSWEREYAALEARESGTARSRGSWFGGLRYLRPILHLPLPAADEKGLGVGILLLGTDPLGNNMYSASASYGFESKRASYYAFYQSYALPRVRIDLTAQDVVQPTGIEYCHSEDEYWWKRLESYGFAVAWPMIELTRSAELMVGMNLKRTRAALTEDVDESLIEPDFFTGRTTESYGGTVFSNARMYPLSFSPEDGIFVSAFYRNWHKSLGGEMKGVGGDVDFRAYKRITNNAVIAARLMAVKGLKGDIEYGSYSRLTPAGQDSTLVTSRAALGSAEVRFRIAETQTKMMWDWVFVNRLHGALFFDLGYYYDESDEKKSSWEQSHSYGARLSLDSTLGFMLPITWDFIVAVPSLGDPKFYVGTMTAF